MKQLDYQEIVEKDIFELLGAPKNISESEKQALILKMYRTIENRVISRVIDNLNEAEIKEFDKNLKLGQKEAADYLNSKGIDFNKLILEETIILKTELAELVKNHGMKR